MSFPKNKKNTIAKADVTAKRNTMQKEVVTEVVLNSCDHPTAETIFERAKDKLPGIGVATVYRCLNGLVQEGKVREITVPNAPSRFDKTTRIHAHFVCRLCGEVTDVIMDENRAIEEVAAANDNCIDEAEIIFRGICGKCAK